MNTFDIICIVATSLLAIRGMYIGFLEEFSRKGSILFGVVFAIMFTGPLTSLLSGVIAYLHLGIWGTFVIGILMLITGYFIMRFFIGIIDKTVEAWNMDFVDHVVLGFALGVIEGIVLILIFWYFSRFQKIIPMSIMFADSWIIEQFKPVLIWMLKIDFKAYVSDFKL